MKYLVFLLYIHMHFNECTIDINIQELVYIADHLSEEECYRLYASLNFVCHDLPANLSDAEKKVPKDVPCIKLLIKWNSGEEKWEGKGKTHAEMERRLRQLGKNDLADWLGKLVFHQLAKHVNKSLEEELLFEEHKHENCHHKHRAYIDKDSRTPEVWTTLDSILSVTLFSLLLITLCTFCRMLKLTFRRSRAKRKDCKNVEEVVDLLSTGSVDTDQETVNELDVENDKHCRDSFELDLEKVSKETLK